MSTREQKAARARMGRTGERYTTALRHVRGDGESGGGGVDGFIDANRRELRKVLSEHHDLSLHGWHTVCSPEFAERYPRNFHYRSETQRDEERDRLLDDQGVMQFAVAREFLNVPDLTRKTQLARPGSYGLKHEVEHWTRSMGPEKFYVANGALIAAAICRSLTPKRDDRGLNCTFNARLPTLRLALARPVPDELIEPIVEMNRRWYARSA